MSEEAGVAAGPLPTQKAEPCAKLTKSAERLAGYRNHQLGTRRTIPLFKFDHVGGDLGRPLGLLPTLKANVRSRPHCKHRFQRVVVYRLGFLVDEGNVSVGEGR